MKILITIVILVLGTALIGAVYLLGSKQLQYTAIDQCLSAGKTQFVRNGQTLTGPDGYWFQFCMKQKGIK